jgi:hypothetical protein
MRSPWTAGLHPRHGKAVSLFDHIGMAVTAAEPRGAIHRGKRREYAMYIDKSDIVVNLRSRGLAARADWVDRSLPQMVDIDKNAALLQTLGIDPATMSLVDAAEQQN